jgi:hypothetical protein
MDHKLSRGLVLVLAALQAKAIPVIDTLTVNPTSTASTIVTCATSIPNLVQNPSFEDGFTNWGYASGTTGSVVSGDAADGSYYLYEALLFELVKFN